MGQQWFVIGTATKFRLINRYSGLALALSNNNDRKAETTPTRDWTDTHHTKIGDSRTANEQTLQVRTHARIN